MRSLVMTLLVLACLSTNAFGQQPLRSAILDLPSAAPAPQLVVETHVSNSRSTLQVIFGTVGTIGGISLTTWGIRSVTASGAKSVSSFDVYRIGTGITLTLGGIYALTDRH